MRFRGRVEAVYRWLGWEWTEGAEQGSHGYWIETLAGEILNDLESFFRSMRVLVRAVGS